MVTDPIGVPAKDLSDSELERQGTQAHATRNWVFLHGTAQQFERHTERMLELEQEYLRRYPKRTWQGASDEPVEVDEATRLRGAMRGLVVQLQALLDDPARTEAAAHVSAAGVVSLLSQVAAAPGSRLHRLELHQAARRAGVDPVAVAQLYRGDEPMLSTDGPDRVLTDAGRAHLESNS